MRAATYYMGGKHSVKWLADNFPVATGPRPADPSLGLLVGDLLSIPILIAPIVPENEVWLLHNGRVTHIVDIGEGN